MAGACAAAPHRAQQCGYSDKERGGGGLGHRHCPDEVTAIDCVIDTSVGEGSCPAAIVADDGNIYVQGYLPSKEAAKTLTAPAGESFVSIPLAMAKKIAAQVSEL